MKHNNKKMKFKFMIIVKINIEVLFDLVEL